MGIKYYSGTEGATIEINNIQDVWDALDNIQTQIIENIGEDHPVTEMVGRLMDELIEKYQEIKP
jgi:hypothetical protein